MKIKDVILRETFDSTARPALEVELVDEEGRVARSQAPQGKSKGGKEAVSFDFEKARSSLNEIKPEVLDKNFASISEFDNKLMGLDGTENKSRLGGNLLLVLSISFARLLSIRENKQLWEILRDEYFGDYSNSPKPPKILANLIEGGAHANNNLTFQEYLIIAEVSGGIAELIKGISQFYADLIINLNERCKVKIVPIGDEAGACPDFKNNLEPLEALSDLIKEGGHENKFKIAIDAAANSFYKEGLYTIDEQKLDPQNLLDYYSELFNKFELLKSIEDPFEEGDFESFKKLKEVVGQDKLVVGDDLTVTNKELISKAKDSINGVIIKPNQVGTVSETAESINTAKEENLNTIISHRAGETEDNFIIHLARASNAFGLKIGVPQRERVTKYNELIRLFD